MVGFCQFQGLLVYIWTTSSTPFSVAVSFAIPLKMVKLI